MSEEEQLLAIVKLLEPQHRWERILDPDGKTWVIGFRYPAHRGYIKAQDYLHDLNACHTAEKTLKPHERIIYCAKLIAVGVQDPDCCNWDIVHATAAQRCEAFLRCKSLWREER